jgi:tRNA(fMet)-specific endonuclease VapC
VLPRLVVLPYETDVARRCGQVQAELEGTGEVLADADAVIAATALYHDLVLVTGNLRHFRRIAGLRISPILSEARRDRA